MKIETNIMRLPIFFTLIRVFLVGAGTGLAVGGEKDLVKENKGAAAQGTGVLSEADTVGIRPVVDSVNELGWDWLKEAVKEKPGENVCVSPLSLMTLSAALARGGEG